MMSKDKCNRCNFDRDLLLYGKAFMLDGKHVPFENVISYKFNDDGKIDSVLIKEEDDLNVHDGDNVECETYGVSGVDRLNDLEKWCNDLTTYGVALTIDDNYVPWSDVVTLCEKDVITICYRTEDGLRYANSSNNFIQIERL